MTWLSIAAGGALGSLARHVVNVVLQPADARFPVGIAVVNISGCLMIGVLAGLLASSRLALSSTSREFVFVGVLGGFTTFSTFGLDAFQIARTNPGLAALTVGAQVGGGLIAVWLGYTLASR